MATFKSFLDRFNFKPDLKNISSLESKLEFVSEIKKMEFIKINNEHYKTLGIENGESILKKAFLDELLNSLKNNIKSDNLWVSDKHSITKESLNKILDDIYKNKVFNLEGYRNPISFKEGFFDLARAVKGYQISNVHDYSQNRKGDFTSGFPNRFVRGFDEETERYGKDLFASFKNEIMEIFNKVAEVDFNKATMLR